MKTILSIDFDFWAEHDVLSCDFGHRESPFFIETMWSCRAAYMFMRDARWKPSSMVRVSRNEPAPRDFRDYLSEQCSVRFNADGELSIAESHASIVPWLDTHFANDTLQIINVDAHCDWGYSGSSGDAVDCGEWVRTLVEDCRIARIVQQYPSWNTLDWSDVFERRRDVWSERGIDIEVSHGLNGGWLDGGGIDVDGVFICRSGAWVPPWLDGHFEQLVLSFLEAFDHFELYTFDACLQFIRHMDWHSIRMSAFAASELPGMTIGNCTPEAALSGRNMEVDPCEKG